MADNTPTTYVDLMGFAKGAEFANQQNWRDTINDINTRATEDALARQQAVFGAQFPLMQEQNADQLAGIQAAREAASWQASVGKTLQAVPAEQRGMALAQQIRDRMSQIDPTTPAGARVAQSLMSYASQAALQYQKAGDTAAAGALQAAAGQPDTAKRAEQFQQFNDPAFLNDPAKLSAATGAVFEPATGTFNWAGMPGLQRNEVASIAALRAINPYADVNTVFNQLQQIRARAAGEDAKAAMLTQQGWKEGVHFTRNPITREVLPGANSFTFGQNVINQQPAPQVAPVTTVPAQQTAPVTAVPAQQMAPTVLQNLPSVNVAQIPTGGLPSVAPQATGPQAYGFTELLSRMFTPPPPPMYRSGYRDFSVPMGISPAAQIPTTNWITR